MHDLKRICQACNLRVKMPDSTINSLEYSVNNSPAKNSFMKSTMSSTTENNNGSLIDYKALILKQFHNQAANQNSLEQAARQQQQPIMKAF
jgi:hypothetical protein